MSDPEPGGPRPPDGTITLPRRPVLIVGVIVLALLAFGGGYLLARGGGDEPAPSASPASPSSEPTATPSESPSPSPSPSASPSPPPVLEDGRHFAFPKRATAGGAWTLTFDLAYFYIDQEAIEQCGDAPGGYCIVNDNPKLRTLPVAPTVVVRYISLERCCNLRPGNFPSLARAINGGAPGDYEPTAPYWITVRQGQIVRIEQQYLP